jgi:hypothetical protein
MGSQLFWHRRPLHFPVYSCGFRRISASSKDYYRSTIGILLDRTARAIEFGERDDQVVWGYLMETHAHNSPISRPKAHGEKRRPILRSPAFCLVSLVRLFRSKPVRLNLFRAPRTTQLEQYLGVSSSPETAKSLNRFLMLVKYGARTQVRMLIVPQPPAQ